MVIFVKIWLVILWLYSIVFVTLLDETSLDLANVSVVPNYNADFYLNQLVVTLSLSVSASYSQ